MKKFLKSLISDTHPLRLMYHRIRSWCAAWLAGFPARKLTVIAVTGTDGKTTTVSMVSHILHRCGKRVGATSTAFLEIDGVREPNPTQKTSLTAAALQSFLRRLVGVGIQYAVIEVSSHGLTQGRLNGVRPSVAAITNISMEHLDYHGSMKEYIRAKGLLFHALKGCGTKVLNTDDETYDSYKGIASENIVVYSPKNQLSGIASTAVLTTADVQIDERQYTLSLPIPGIFNLYNALCAICCSQAIGIEPERSIEALQSYTGTPGRLERIDAGQDFSVFVDFTVTPVAYERTLSSLRSMLASGRRLIVVTGSCGDRMPEKRPLVGKICSELADIVLVTNEDPYTEDPEKIIDEVLSGVTKQTQYQSEQEYDAAKNRPESFSVRISSRLSAVRIALHEAKSGDIVLFCGKGADVTMMTAHGQIPWNECKIVMEELKKLLRM